jgi:hypothetical protein
LQELVARCELQDLTSRETILVKNTAAYLMCMNILNETQRCIDLNKQEIGLLKQQAKINEATLTKFEIIESENLELRKKVEEDETKVDAFNSLNNRHINGLQCQSLRLRRSHNTCGKTFMVVSHSHSVSTLRLTCHLYAIAK